MIVVDSSAVIAVLRSEPAAERVADLLEGAAISTVNVAEIVTHAVRGGIDASELRSDLQALKLVVHAFDEDGAVSAGALAAQTARYGLSLGDRACLALALQLKARAVTADRTWRKIDIGVEIEVFR